MADVASRREARRRKILENSHNRLQLITGKNNHEHFKESPTKSPISNESIENLPLSANSSSDKLNNGIIITEREHFSFNHLESFLSENRDIDAAGDGDVVNNDLAAFISPNAEPVEQKPSFWAKVITYKYDIVLLSLLIQLFYGLSFITFDGIYFFLPPFIYIVTKLIWIPIENNSSIANAFLMLNGMSASRVQKIMHITQWVGLICQDIFIYLFVTICMQALYITLKNDLVT